MTDRDWLFAIACLIYAGECLVWLPHGAQALLCSLGCAGKLRTSPVNFSSRKGGWVFANPLPPLGTVFVVRPWPFSLTEEAFAPFPVETPDPRNRRQPSARTAIPWSEAERIARDGKKILVNGHPVLVESSPEAAECWTKILIGLRDANRGNRVRRIAKLRARAWNSRRCRKRLRFWERATLPLRLHCNLLFLVLFAAIPVTLVFHGPAPRFWATVAVGLVLMILAAVQFHALHRRFYPSAGFERWQWTMLILLVPQQSVRALDLLSKAFFADSHPLVVADAVLPSGSEHRARALGRMWRDLRHPLAPKGLVDEKTEAVIENYRQQVLLPAMRAFREVHPEETADWETPLREEDAVRFCPRCANSFVDEKAIICNECRGMPLRAWPEGKAAAG